jgi:hypothetical protein
MSDDEPMEFGATVMTDDGLAVSAWTGEDRPMNTWFIEGCDEIYEFDQLRNPRMRTR